MPEMPIAEITERLHGDVVKVLRATRTSSLLIILIDDHARDAMFAEIMRVVPPQFQDREWQWLGRTVVEEIDRRIPIPTRPTPSKPGRFEMPKFRKKPVVIEAVQFFPNQRPWPDGVLEEIHPADHESQRRGFETVTKYVVKTLEGEHIASPGDWIITGVKGERYPCKPDIFAATYEPVEE